MNMENNIMNIRTITFPQIPFTHYFQMNVPFYGYFPGEMVLYPCEIPPMFKGHSPVFKSGITGDDGGCIRHDLPCQPIKPLTGEETPEVGQKLHALV